MDRRVIAVIPAHNEEANIGAALASVCSQTLRVDEVVVVADNCTDRTATVARRYGAAVTTTVDNSGKKAGALNQALAVILPALADGDIVLIMDADSRIAPEFLAIAGEELARPEVGAVGGIFYGRRVHGGLIERLQIAEYVRYARQIARNGSRAYVLTGTATAFTAGILRQVAAGRTDGRLPCGPGAYYDEHTMTEDSYMTFAVKTLGYETPSPLGCWVSTEVMPTYRMLWRQRRRWQVGALENLRTFGLWNKVTWAYTARQLISLAELLFLLAYLATATWSGVDGNFRVVPFWITIGVIFWLERIVSVRKAGPVAILIASPMVIEMGYGIFLKAVNVYSYFKVLRGSQISWALPAQVLKKRERERERKTDDISSADRRGRRRRSGRGHDVGADLGERRMAAHGLIRDHNGGGGDLHDHPPSAFRDRARQPVRGSLRP